VRTTISIEIRVLRGLILSYPQTFSMSKGCVISVDHGIRIAPLGMAGILGSLRGVVLLYKDKFWILTIIQRFHVNRETHLHVIMSN